MWYPRWHTHTLNQSTAVHRFHTDALIYFPSLLLSTYPLSPYLSLSHTPPVSLPPFSPCPTFILILSGFNFSSSLTCPCPFLSNLALFTISHHLSRSHSRSESHSSTPPPPLLHSSLSGYRHRKQSDAWRWGAGDKKVMDKSDGKISQGWRAAAAAAASSWFPTGGGIFHLNHLPPSLWCASRDIIQTVQASYRAMIYASHSRDPFLTFIKHVSS